GYHEDYANQYEDTYINHPQAGLNNMDISYFVYDLQEQKVILDTFNCHHHKKEVPCMTIMKVGLVWTFVKPVLDVWAVHCGSVQSNVHRFNNPLHHSLIEGELPADEIHHT
ncbi:hypothetical protein KI387_031966, partial [Taxus chinensis]